MKQTSSKMHSYPSRKLTRLTGYDYSQDGAYFFTSVVKGRVPCLGEVRGGGMHLSAYGEIAQRQWYWLAERYPYVRLHAFVVMPDHVHGILEIDRSKINGLVGTGRDLSLPTNGDDHDLSLPTNGDDHNLSLPTNGDDHDLSLRALPLFKIKSLSELKGAYKTTVSKQIRQAGMPDFAWQRSFHDRIIRDAEEFERIAEYIRTNPARWADDHNP